MKIYMKETFLFLMALMTLLIYEINDKIINILLKIAN